LPLAAYACLGAVLSTMKFLFIHQNFPAQFVHLAPALAALGHEVLALGTRDETPVLHGVRYCAYPFGQPKENAPWDAFTKGLRGRLARADAVASALQQLKSQGIAPDVVIAHSGWGEAFYAKSVFPNAKLQVYAEYFYGAADGDVGFDTEFSQPGLAASQKSAINNLHLMQALVNADSAVSPTEFQRAQHPLELQSKISVIHDGIDTLRFAPNPAAWVQLGRTGITLRAENEVITFVARQLEPYRGYHTFMRALPQLLQSRPRARVVIVGGDGVSYGPVAPQGTSWKKVFLDEVKAHIDMERVHFVGRVPHDTLKQLLQVSTVHVYLTYPFVLSWSLLEAMSMGCLVVASDTAPVREVISDGHNGLLTDFFDPTALAARVADALENRLGMAALKEQARQTIVDRFDLHGVCLPKALQWALGHGADVAAPRQHTPSG
jgi:glycosyltransferase involved in cell wall biosynthesis